MKIKKLTRQELVELYDNGAIASALASRINLSLTSFYVIGCVSKYGELSVNDISCRANLKRTTVSKVLKALVERDLIIITTSTKDAREKRISLNTSNPIWKDIII